MEVQMLTSADFENWGKDAESLQKICNCTRREALLAIFKLRAEEINRDLSPLIKLVDWGYIDREEV